MNILFTTDFFPPDVIGGAEISTYNLANALARKGNNIFVLTRYSKKGIKEKIDIEKNVYVLREINLNKISYDGNLLVNEIGNIIVKNKIEKLLKKEKIDIIHSQNYNVTNGSILSAKNNDIPIITTIRDYWPVCPLRTLLKYNYELCNGNKKFIQCYMCRVNTCISRYSGFSRFAYPLWASYSTISNEIQSKNLKKADYIITVSNFVKDIIKQKYPENKIITVPNFVDTNIIKKEEVSKSPFSEDNINIIFPSRISREKGIWDLINVCKLLKKYKNIKIHVYGSGPELKKLIYKKEKLKLNNLLFYGKISNDLLLKYFTFSDMILNIPVWNEPLGRVALESCNLGKPIISTNVGGIPEIIENGKNGILVQPSNCQQITDSIIKLSDDEKLRRKMGEEGKKIIKKKFSSEVVTKKVIELYKNTLI
jgi:glycosyltransferase involved in cell wall biosynthesis